MDDNNQGFGDGQDNYLNAAKKAMDAAKQAGQSGLQTSAGAGAGAAGATGASAEAAAAGAEAVANAAAASAQATVEGGTAAAEIATGTAAGGPWGAVIAIAWSMRHTLFKVVICACIFILFIACAVVSLPSIVTNNIFHTDPSSVDASGSTNLTQNFDNMSSLVSDCVSSGYDYSLSEVQRIIADGGYNYEYSMDALINYSQASADYDTCYILATYSASMKQKGTTANDLQSKLDAVKSKMFPVTYEEKTTTVTIPATEDSEETTETIRYVECTIHPFDKAVILEAFDVDPNAMYDQFNITYGEAITNMSNALKMTLYGTVGSGSVPAITDAELNAILAKMNCSSTRKEIMRVAISLVGKVPYFWGGKSPPGWNNEWNTPKLVTSTGSSETGTIRPYGLDCSGFTTWVYNTAIGFNIGEGTTNQWNNTEEITETQLLPGDFGFKDTPYDSGINHVLLYVGKDDSGNNLWVNCAGGTGVIIDSPDYVRYFRRLKGYDLEAALTSSPSLGEPLYTIQADVTHYCSCTLCCGPNANGITASGKQISPGMVAMSSYYPFGTQIMIDGIMYTVEDRGGSSIENDRTRVDIFVPDHQEALRLGRFQTEAKIYRIGR